jgi:hypothetical protein
MKDTMIIQCPCGATLTIEYTIQHTDPTHKQTRLL